MNTDYTDSNKLIIEQFVAEVGEDLNLALRVEWIDATSRLESSLLKIFCEGHTQPAILEFHRDLWFKTWMPEPGEDVAEFLKDEKEQRPESYQRKKDWKTRISQAVKREFLEGGEPIGFNPLHE